MKSGMQLTYANLNEKYNYYYSRFNTNNKYDLFWNQLEYYKSFYISMWFQ